MLFNAHLHLDPYSIVARSFCVERDDHLPVPDHKVFAATDLFNGHSYGRMNPEYALQTNNRKDLRKFEHFKDYINDKRNEQHLSSIELMLKDHQNKDFFDRLTKARLISDCNNRFPMDLNL